jgi:hypothetical protein
MIASALADLTEKQLPRPVGPTAFAIALTGGLLVCVQAPAFSRQSDLSQKHLAEVMTTGTYQAKDAAIGDVLAIPAERRLLILEEALIEELQRLNTARWERFRRLRSGQPLEPEGEGHGEYRLAVTQAVAQSSNPNVIPALIGALGSGTGVSRALAKFGDAAVAPVASFARGPSPDTGATDDALRALQFMIEGSTPLSSRSRSQILTVAAERLTGSQDFTNVTAAIGLAIAIKDMTLRRRVEQLASDPTQLREMGIPEGRQRFVRDAAVAALKRKQSW